MTRPGREKLRVKQRKTMEIEDSTPPNNQEALNMDLNKEPDFEDLDLTDLTENAGKPPIDIAFETVKSVESLMKERLHMAKAREWLAYGRTSSNLPPFCHINLRCNPDLGNTDNNDIFKELMGNTISETRNLFLDKTIETLDILLKEKKEVITSVRQEAIAKIGQSSKSAGNARKTMYKKLGELKDENDSELAEFKADIRYNTAKRHDRRGNNYEDNNKGMKKRRK